MKEVSASVAMLGRAMTGVSGAMKTMPWDSATAAGEVRRARGGTVAPAPSDGISTQVPSPSNRQP